VKSKLLSKFEWPGVNPEIFLLQVGGGLKAGKWGRMGVNPFSPAAMGLGAL